MKVITVVNQKGGCGKTITAINLAAAISGRNKKVLFIDLDPQAHATAAFGLDLSDSHKSSYALFDTFLNEKELDLAPLMHHKYDNLWVMGSHLSLSTMEQKMSGMEDAVLALSKSLRGLSVPDFDYVLIDTPPNLGFLTLNAILAANQLIVPLDISLFSLNGVNQIREILSISSKMGFEKPETRFLLTLFDGRSNFAKNFLQKAKQQYGDSLLNTVIRSNVKLREAVLAGKVIFEYDPHANGAKDYFALADEIAPELATVKTINLQHVADEINSPQIWFKLNAPEAKYVYITGTFNNWAKDETSLMKKLDSGMWVKMLPIPEGTYHYKFIVDGKWKEDPNNSQMENDRFGGKNSVISVKSA